MSALFDGVPGRDIHADQGLVHGDVEFDVLEGHDGLIAVQLDPDRRGRLHVGPDLKLLRGILDQKTDRVAPVDLSLAQVLHLLRVIGDLLHDVPDQLQDILGALCGLSLDVHDQGGLALGFQRHHLAAVQVEDHDHRQVGHGPPDAISDDDVMDHRRRRLRPRR